MHQMGFQIEKQRMSQFGVWTNAVPALLLSSATCNGLDWAKCLLGLHVPSTSLPLACMAERMGYTGQLEQRDHVRPNVCFATTALPAHSARHTRVALVSRAAVLKSFKRLIYRNVYCRLIRKSKILSFISFAFVVILGCSWGTKYLGLDNF